MRNGKSELHGALARAAGLARRADEHAAVADLAVRLERFDEAIAHYERAIALEPGNARFLFNRAAVRRFRGELEDAERDYDLVIELAPNDSEAWLNRSDLRLQTESRNHVVALEKQLAKSRGQWADEVTYRYALAKEYEDIGDYRRSWMNLQSGAALRRRHLQYDVSRDVATVDWITEAFPQALLTTTDSAARQPIFIVGMPRSGTTLLERVLAAGEGAVAAGELDAFARALVDAAQRQAGNFPLGRRELVTASATVDFPALGDDYLRRAKDKVGAVRFIDKMPLNYLYCGLIVRALPGARILHLVRHPLATCHAMFKVLFKQGYPFSYSLTDIAEYYISYRRLMDHWHRILPGQIHDVSYERLVSHPAAEAQAASEFCGLPWNPACLDSASQGGITTTASAAQVRRPIYTDSVDKWRHYEDELAPLAARLRNAGIDVG